MHNSIVALPVTIEQIASVVRHMSTEEQQRLLELAPELKEALRQRTPRTISEARAAAEAMRQELVACLENRPLSLDEPFMGNLTLNDYLSLPDEERARLWDEWAKESVESVEEVRVRRDALPAR
jgi:hypothetical protein